jgi:hypothetical protein
MYPKKVHMSFSYEKKGLEFPEVDATAKRKKEKTCYKFKIQNKNKGI